MNALSLLPSLYFDALVGRTDLGLAGAAVTVIGLIALAVALVTAWRRPSWRLLWLLLPLAVVLPYLQLVGILGIGSHAEALTVSCYLAALLVASVLAAFMARANRLAVTGILVFSLACSWIAWSATLFVFWTALH